LSRLGLTALPKHYQAVTLNGVLGETPCLVQFQSSLSEETGGATPVPIFLDRHDLSGLTASDIAEAHRKDLEVQDQYGDRFLTYWFDESRGTGFCLIDAPDIKTAMRVHDEAHGDVAKDVIEVDLSAVQAFLGRVSDPEPSGEANNVTIDSALRAIMFTDIVGSTSMTERLGDARSVEMVRAHDALVRRALKDKGGHVVKHTGDGILRRRGRLRAMRSCHPASV
jgi:hypothetical protein